MVMDGQCAQSVGREFVRQYYTMLHEAPKYLHRFYSHDSSFLHDGMNHCDVSHEQLPAIGQTEINRSIESLNFRDCHARIRQVDSQPSVSGSVVIQVVGELSNNSIPLRRFMQTFVLVPQSPKKFYVHNDIFRYQDEVFSEGPKDYEEASMHATKEPSAAAEAVTAAVVDEVASGELEEVKMEVSVDLGYQGDDESANGNTTETAVEVETQQLVTATTPVQQQSPQSPPLPQTTQQQLSPTQKPEKEPQQQSPQQSHQAADSTPPQKLSWAAMAKKGVARQQPTNHVVTKQQQLTNHLVTKQQQQQPTNHVVTKQQQQPSNHVVTKQQQQPSNHVVTKQQQQPSNRVATKQQANNHVISKQQQIIETPEGEGLNNDVAVAKQPGDVADVREEAADGVGKASKRSDTEEDASKFMQQYPDNQQVFIGNIPHNMPDSELHEFFAKFGTVLDIRINRKNNNNLPNFGFVLFESPEMVQKILTQRPLYNGKHRVNVEEKKRREDLTRPRSSHRGGKTPRGGHKNAPRNTPSTTPKVPQPPSATPKTSQPLSTSPKTSQPPSSTSTKNSAPSTTPRNPPPPPLSTNPSLKT